MSLPPHAVAVDFGREGTTWLKDPLGLLSGYQVLYGDLPVGPAPIQEVAR